MRRCGCHWRMPAMMRAGILVLALLCLLLDDSLGLAWTGNPALAARRKQQQLTSTTLFYFSENATTASSLFLAKNQTATSATVVGALDDRFTGLSAAIHKHYNGKRILPPTAANNRITRQSSSARLQVPGTTVPQTNHTASSIGNAVAQVHAIMDLYDVSNSVSSVIVALAVEGVILKTLHSAQRSPDDSRVLLNTVERLMLRLVDLGITPTTVTLTNLWELQRQRLQNRQAESPDVERAATLLRHWLQWTKEPSSGNHTTGTRLENDDDLMRPQSLLVHALELFQVAKRDNISMSTELWELFEHVRTSLACDNHSDWYVHELATEVLQVLAASPLPWKGRQCYLLQQLERRHFPSINNSSTRSIYVASEGDLESALQGAALAGNAQDASWLFRRLASQGANHCSCQDYWRLLMQAFHNSNHTGAAAYMERILKTEPAARCTETYTLALSKRAASKQPGSGLRAEGLLQAMVDHNSMPNLESLHHAVMAHLAEEPLQLPNITNADRLVRRIVMEHDLVNATKPAADGCNHQWRIFDQLLKAYAELDPITHKAVKAADRLFRFFLVQHRDGKITEEPDHIHLDRILTVLHRGAENAGAEKSVELYRLMQDLALRGSIRKGPTHDNALLLLKTLARSKLPGYGTLAEQLLEDMVQSTAAVPPKVLEQMGECVADCLRRDGNLDGSQRQTFIAAEKHAT